MCICIRPRAGYFYDYDEKKHLSKANVAADAAAAVSATAAAADAVDARKETLFTPQKKNCVCACVCVRICVLSTDRLPVAAVTERDRRPASRPRYRAANKHSFLKGQENLWHRMGRCNARARRKAATRLKVR